MLLELVRFRVQSVMGIRLNAVLSNVADFNARPTSFWIGMLQNQRAMFSGARMRFTSERCSNPSLSIRTRIATISSGHRIRLRPVALGRSVGSCRSRMRFRPVRGRSRTYAGSKCVR